jgi:anti-sigma regulatory factor (Ser/Thr protein kinase)
VEIGADNVLPRDTSAPGRARRLLQQHFGAALEPDDLHTAKLLASELVTNAVRHGEGSIRLKAHLNEDRVRIEVFDEGGGFQYQLEELDFEAVGGRGLHIVDAEASRWGVYEGSTHVWFEVERSGPRLGR